MLRQTMRFIDFSILRAASYILSRMALIIVVAAYVLATLSDFPQVVTLWEDYTNQHEMIGAIILAATLIIVSFSLRGDRRAVWAVLLDAVLLAIPAVALCIRAQAGFPSIGIISIGWLISLAIRLRRFSKRSRGYLVANMVVVVGIVAGFAVLYAVLRNGNPEYARRLGTIDLTLIFVGLVSGLVAVLSLYRTAALVIALVCIAGLAFNHLDHTAPNKTILAQSRYELPDAFSLWLFDRADAASYRDNHLPYPVFLVSSAGGGGYAAAHSFSFLMKTATSCPNFVQHTFAMVGVSGGQVGNALFHANLPGDPNPRLTEKCAKETVSNEALATFLSADNLAPVIGQLLFVELPEKLLFLPQSGIGRSAALMRSLQDIEGGFRPVPDIPFIEHLWIPTAASEESPSRYEMRGVPAMISVATNIASGNRFIFSPFEFETEGELHLSMYAAAGDHKAGQQRLEDASLVAATVASASFPWINPSVRLGASWAFNKEVDPCGAVNLPTDCSYTSSPEVLAAMSGKRLQSAVNLVDGGYFEASGIETVSELVRHIMKSTPSLSVAEMDQRYGFRSLPQFKNCETVSGHFVASIYGVHPGTFGYDESGDVFEELTPPPSDIEETGSSERSEASGWDDCSVPFTVEVIILKDYPVVPPRVAPGQDFLFDPIVGLLSAQSARGELAVKLLEERNCAGDEGGGFCDLYLTEVGAGHPYTRLFERMYPSLINAAEQGMPLGWDMPEEATKNFVTYVAPSDALCNQLLPGGWDSFFTAEDLPANDIPGAPAFAWKNCFNYLQLKMLFEPEGLLRRIFWLP